VAAIAAGVLINTAGFLQTQAEQTGEQSSDQVTDRLEPVETTGNVTDSGQLDKIDFVLQKSPGASDINVSKSTLSFIGPDGTERYELFADANGINYTTYQDGDNSLDGVGKILNDEADRLVITMNLDNSSISSGLLDAGETAEVEITGQSGATTIIQLTVPQSLDGERSVTL
jgi:archaellin